MNIAQIMNIFKILLNKVKLGGTILSLIKAKIKISEVQINGQTK
ncbi:hypothetical protein HMPREF0531_10994 [Lactiplantibacillus plantarum subsp. plantarum ATCC 14917 = JCM 1149 = CGMCC 1.2437]|nr:hypothetical protein HMPREF0531_10994 [Lactiplantibacillus plantarum subsp. plantarum ATCC 14917 = JCM 1149 = CGMCC 1.2437]